MERTREKEREREQDEEESKCWRRGGYQLRLVCVVDIMPKMTESIFNKCCSGIFDFIFSL